MDRFDTSERGSSDSCECSKCEISICVDDALDDGLTYFCQECGKEEQCEDCERLVGADNLNEDCVCEDCAAERKFDLKVDAYQQAHQEREE